MSLSKLLEIGTKKTSEYIFTFAHSNDQNFEAQQFFSIKIKQFQLGEARTSIFQISNITQKILYDIS